jgi:hypothetical protein
MYGDCRGNFKFKHKDDLKLAKPIERITSLVHTHDDFSSNQLIFDNPFNYVID